MMIRLTIDNRTVEVEPGATILDAARKLGIEIPAMCHLAPFEPSTSCMVCVVKVNGSAKLIPSCGALAQDGMVIESDCPDVIKARTAALELLLSDHLGDCAGPCQIGCPAGMNIPLMLRQIAAGDLTGAIETVKADIALPAVLGRICPAPCEKVCRRGDYDSAVSICLLKRFVADSDLAAEKPYAPKLARPVGKKVALIGAGPAGLSCAYYLAQAGLDCTIFDDNQKPGGALRTGLGPEKLTHSVLDREIHTILSLGVQFRPNTKIGKDIVFEKIRADFNAVFIATGPAKDGSVFNLERTEKGIKTEGRTFQTSVEGVFAGGDVIGSRRLAVRSSADGKEAAFSIVQYLRGDEVTGTEKTFNTRIGKLVPQELETFLAPADRIGRQLPVSFAEGFTGAQARAESTRCLHCDCRKAGSCRLRSYSAQYHARPGRYKTGRRTFSQNRTHPAVIYEPGKCIDCGLCIKTAAAAKEKLGLTFVGRGFDVKVAPAFDESLADALQKSALECVKNCPTGALAINEQDSF